MWSLLLEVNPVLDTLFSHHLGRRGQFVWGMRPRGVMRVHRWAFASDSVLKPELLDHPDQDALHRLLLSLELFSEALEPRPTSRLSNCSGSSVDLVLSEREKCGLPGYLGSPGAI